MKCIDIYSSFRFCQQVNRVDFYFRIFIFWIFLSFQCLVVVLTLIAHLGIESQYSTILCFVRVSCTCRGMLAPGAVAHNPCALIMTVVALQWLFEQVCYPDSDTSIAICLLTWDQVEGQSQSHVTDIATKKQFLKIRIIGAKFSSRSSICSSGVTHQVSPVPENSITLFCSSVPIHQ